MTTPQQAPRPADQPERTRSHLDEIAERIRAERRPSEILPPGYRLMGANELQRVGAVFNHPIHLLHLPTQATCQATVRSASGPSFEASRVQVEVSRTHAIANLVPRRGPSVPDDPYPGAVGDESLYLDPPQFDEDREYVAIVRTDQDADADEDPNDAVHVALRFSIALAEKDRQIRELHDEIGRLRHAIGVLPIDGKRRVS